MSQNLENPSQENISINLDEITGVATPMNTDINLNAAMSATSVEIAEVTVPMSPNHIAAPNVINLSPINEVVIVDEGISNLEIISKPSDNLIINHKDKELGFKEIFSVSPLTFQSFLTALKVVSQNSTPQTIIKIKDGQLVASHSGGVIDCDLRKTYNNFSWNIINPSNALKYLNLFTKTDECDKISIMQNDKQVRVYNTNDKGELLSTITLPIPIQTSDDTSETGKNKLGKLLATQTISPDEVKRVLDFQKMKSMSSLTLAIDVNTKEFVSIAIEGIYEKFFILEKGRKLEKLRVYNLFPLISKDEIEIELYEGEDDELYLKTMSHFNHSVMYFQIKASRVSLSQENGNLLNNQFL